MATKESAPLGGGYHGHGFNGGSEFFALGWQLFGTTGVASGHSLLPYGNLDNEELVLRLSANSQLGS